MPPGLKDQLGLGEPSSPGSTAQADNFKASFQGAIGPVNTALQYTAAHANQKKNAPHVAKRDKAQQAYQAALAKIDPKNPAVAQGAIDQVLAAVTGLAPAVEAFRAEAQKAFDDWTARQGEVDTLADKVREMVDWGHEKAAALQTVIDAVRGKADEKSYDEALVALGQLTDKAKPIIDEYEKQRLAQAEFEPAWEAAKPRVAKANQNAFAPLADQATGIADAASQAEQSTAKKDYVAGLETLRTLESSLDEFERALAEQEESKQRYETGWEALQPRLSEVAQSDATRGYLTDLQGEMATLQSEMEGAAQQQDYTAALEKLEGLTAKVDECFALIEEKKLEYEAARALLETRIVAADECVYDAVSMERQASLDAVSMIDEAAANEDWEKALLATDDAARELEAFEAAREAHEATLRAEIEKVLPGAKTALSEMSDSASPTKGTAEKLIAGVEAAMSGGGDLEQAVKDAQEAAKQVAELKQVYDIRKRLDDKWDVNKDAEARKIVEELQASGKLKDLPMEARNALVDELMDGYLSDDDDKAIQKVFAIPAIDRRFNDVDKATRQKIVDAYTGSPEVQAMRDNWPKMNEAERIEAVKKLTEIPVGKEGWDVGMPKEYVFENKPAKDGKTSYGVYNSGSETMTINLHKDAHGDFTELLDTIAHEMGHRYQAKVVAEYESGKLKPGDAQYEQAKAFVQHQDYKRRSPDGFKKIYPTSPKEAHSREMGSEIKKGVKAKLGGGSGGAHDEDDDHDH
ncbi:MAG: hypothetical protein ACRCT8_03805 [Lacipirellulaceae bacterium]